ncbi:MAG TPA: hypothetical protein DDZ80_06990 [Cyanobacteria bacterium UBA8803]|nr:hypothetical protein [Cyanobacteria bacterium UBA9273]HBL58265.1 hypothetical protein [Cyanobacteria bacterium UBA8803]
MQDIQTTNSNTTVETQLFQPRLILQALVFTAILYFSANDRSLNSRGRVSDFNTHLSVAVGSAVLQEAAQHSQLPTSALRLVAAQPQTWSDNCLELGNSEVACTPIPVPGWQVAVASGKQRLIYRTDTSGSVIKLEEIKH